MNVDIKSFLQCEQTLFYIGKNIIETDLGGKLLKTNRQEDFYTLYSVLKDLGEGNLQYLYYCLLQQQVLVPFPLVRSCATLPAMQSVYL